ncbi:hypothetical protein BJY00DRAFT_313645 [Aspergillus carlsbadensis]|nr:hypothetical protein BJY00DRAFT_313645 [Aspergillus carlsbadensis]
MTTTQPTTHSHTHTHARTPSPSPTGGERILRNCEIIWGKGSYDLEVEADDWETWWALVRRDYGSSYGGPLTMTGICSSEDDAWAELDRMLTVWAQQVQSGEPMTEDKGLEIFGGPRGEHKSVLRQFWGELRRRGSRRHEKGEGKRGVK